MTSGCAKGHRISGDSVGSWFQKPAISSRKILGGYRRTNLGISTDRGLGALKGFIRSPRLHSEFVFSEKNKEETFLKNTSTSIIAC